MRDSWSCGNQKLTDGETFAQPAHHRRAGWTLRGNRYPPTLTAFRMTDAARWMRSNEPESASRSPRYPTDCDRCRQTLDGRSIGHVPAARPVWRPAALRRLDPTGRDPSARQYSAASMIVRTRTVWRGSLGSSLP
jgi:hypothetical protein